MPTAKHKSCLSLLLLVLLFPACNNVDREIDREIKSAAEARKKSDSILDEFNKVNDQLKDENKKMKGVEEQVTADSLIADSIKNAIK